MTDPELKLRCLELGMAQARVEQAAFDRNVVVEIATLFYNHISSLPETTPVVKGKGQKSADKSAPIFE